MLTFMPLSIKYKKKKRLLVVFYVVVLAIFSCLFYLALRLYFPQQILISVRNALTAESSKGEIRLSQYKIKVEALPLSGVKNLVGFTLDSDEGHLVAIADNHLVDISKTGQVLRRRELYGISTPEKIAYIDSSTILISQGDKESLALIRKNESKGFFVLGSDRSFKLDFGHARGYGGITYLNSTRELLVISRLFPFFSYRVVGFPYDTIGGISITDGIRQDNLLALRDISSVSYDEVSGNYIVLSAKSFVLLELNPSGSIVSALSLLGGLKGLSDSVPNAVGAVIDKSRRIFVISKPNLLYIYEPVLNENKI